MSWLQRVFSLMGNSSLQPEAVIGNYSLNLKPSLSGRSDRISQKRTDLGLPLEYVGPQGEYDPQGLAKRVAQTFDQHPRLQKINTLCIIQHGSKITLLGKVASDALLQQVVELAKQVEGTREVDVRQVVVEENFSLSSL